MSSYDAGRSQKLYEEYLRTDDEKYIPQLLDSVDGLIDSVIFKEFSGYDEQIRKEFKQDAYLFLIDIFRHKYIRLDGNYTSFLYEYIKGYILRRIENYYSPAQIVYYAQDPQEVVEITNEIYIKNIHDFIDLDYLNHVKHLIRKIHREVPEISRVLCKFTCTYYLAKREFPTPEIIKSKFKRLSHSGDLYQKIRIHVKKRIVEMKLNYLGGDD